MKPLSEVVTGLLVIPIPIQAVCYIFTLHEFIMIWFFSTYTNIWAPRLFGTLEFIESSLAQIL